MQDVKAKLKVIPDSLQHLIGFRPQPQLLLQPQPRPNVPEQRIIQ